jgi:hypothetical protein
LRQAVATVEFVKLKTLVRASVAQLLSSIKINVHIGMLVGEMLGDSPNSIQEELATIERLARIPPQISEAERQFLALIRSIEHSEIIASLPAIRSALGEFYPKRRRILQSALDERLQEAEPADRGEAGSRIVFRSHHIRDFQAELRSGFTTLSDEHIFQWATFYREFVDRTFQTAHELLSADESSTALMFMLRQEYALHSCEIFEKGYQYTTSRGGSDHAHALQKSLSGLERFLELPLETYSATSRKVTQRKEARSLRSICSALLSGIVNGYGDTSLGDIQGWQSLPRYPRSWGHVMAFLTYDDLDILEAQLEPGEFRGGVSDTVLPVLAAIEEILEDQSTQDAALPVLGQFHWDFRRLEIALRPLLARNAVEIDVHCYLNASFVDRRLLQDAARRGVVVIAAPIRPDLYDWTLAHDELRTAVVNTSGATASPQSVTQRTREILSFELGRQLGRSGRGTPLTVNFAARFPLESPKINKYFRVQRASVRNLLREYERRNGVRLWCSVRRSGKTTACFDLGSTTGNAVVVPQTCDNIDQRYPDASLFYDRLEAALDSGRRIPNSFFTDTIATALEGKAEASKIVFVLDEYETAFERMRLAVRRDLELRYTVVQPLLNQMVSFAQDNLLVFIGQRPDAHYILMDQNQLSPYVEIDLFPLFEISGGGEYSEFADLITRVMTERVDFDLGFATALYEETGGHPYLTVNVLVVFFDWLINRRRSIDTLHFTREDFEEFSRERLVAEVISTDLEFFLFRKITSSALSSETRERTPWIFSVYSLLRELGRNGNCSLSEFRELVCRLRFEEEFGYTAEYLLSTAVPANFLELRNDVVSPRVRTIGRIAAITTPSIAY